MASCTVHLTLAIALGQSHNHSSIPPTSAGTGQPQDLFRIKICLKVSVFKSKTSMFFLEMHFTPQTHARICFNIDHNFQEEQLATNLLSREENAAFHMIRKHKRSKS